MKDLKKKGPSDPPPGDDMKSNAKLKVLGHLRNMASNMMGDSMKGQMEKYATGGVVKPADAGLDPKGPSVKDYNSMDNEETAEDYNQEHTPESLQEQIDQLQEMKRRVMERKL